MKITIKLAGIPVEIVLEWKNYFPLFSAWSTDEPPLLTARADPHETALARQVFPPESTPHYIEHMVLSTAVSDALIPHGRVIFHSVAFRFRDMAWLITAPSGVGKTTLYLNLKLSFGDEIEMINGDKPILCFDNDGGGITVHPSPWNGKECMGQRISAPLGGIILLSRGENTMRLADMGEAVDDIFRQFIFTPESRERALEVAKLEDRLLRTVPVWRLESRGDTASAALCRETIKNYGKGASV